MDDTVAVAQIATAGAPLIKQAFLRLLEDKHLYQSVDVAPADLSEFVTHLAQTRCKLETQVMPTVGGRGRGRRPQSKKEIVREYSEQVDACLRRLPYLMIHEGNVDPVAKLSSSYDKSIVFSVPTVRTYCTNKECGGLWPHNPCSDPSSLIPSSISGTDLQQVFVLRFQCQNCKRDPVTFLVKRAGLKLTLSGRSPMEEIEIPKYVPKQIHRFYRGAVIAFNSGANLPSLFMLRTTIEQHMRHAINAGDKRMTGDELADAYAETLHADFNTRYQSLRPIYLALSDAIHAARDDDAQLFETERKRVLAHFEAKEVFERLSGH